VTPSLTDVLGEVASRLHERGVRFALVGGLAVSVRTQPRFTRDVDLAVVVADDREAEGVVGALEPSYELVAVLEHSTLDRLAAVRLARAGSPSQGMVVDLLFASSGVEPEVVDTAEPLDVFPTVRVPVAQTGALLALKILSADDSRPVDLVDARALLDVATDEDRALAVRLLDLMEARGASRGRDLRAAWQDLAGRG
jgi:hypothetical protein